MSNPSLRRLRSWWWDRQGLGTGEPPATIDACIRRCGWLPTGGGAGVYLSIHVRTPDASREAIDRAVLDGDPLTEVRGAHARGSMIVPRDEASLALRLAQWSWGKHLAPLFRRGALDRSALALMGKAICRALDEGPLPSGDLRQTVAPSPDAADLFQSALADLLIQGAVRRFSNEGRLDAPTYRYELVHPEDRPDLAAEGDDDAVAERLVTTFLRRHGPATIDDFTWWSAMPKGIARTACAKIRAGRLSIPGWTDEAWLLPEDRQAWESSRASGDDAVRLLPFRDPFIYARRPPAVLTDDADAPVLDWKARRTRVGDVDSLHHHAIVCGGTLVGVWEYDPAAREVVTRIWSTQRGLTDRVKTAAMETRRFIREQLGDAKFYAGDTPTSRAPRITFCRG